MEFAMMFFFMCSKIIIWKSDTVFMTKTFLKADRLKFVDIYKIFSYYDTKLKITYKSILYSIPWSENRYTMLILNVAGY